MKIIDYEIILLNNIEPYRGGRYWIFLQQLDTCSPNFLIQEFNANDLYQQIFVEPIRFEQGYITPPTGPGLGVALDPAVVKRQHRVPLDHQRQAHPAQSCHHSADLCDQQKLMPVLYACPNRSLLSRVRTVVISYGLLGSVKLSQRKGDRLVNGHGIAFGIGAGIGGFVQVGASGGGELFIRRSFVKW